MESKKIKPNIVFIMSDQQRYDTLECYGNDWINTPRLNELAKDSNVVENAYVTQPVCAPARSSIMTGLYPHTAGPTVNKIPLKDCLLYTSPSPRDSCASRMPSSA